MTARSVNFDSDTLLPRVRSEVDMTVDAAPGGETILTREALAFVGALVVTFRPRIESLLAARRERQARIDAGGGFDFLAETKSVRDGDWKVAPLPSDLLDRRVEITGPVDRKMIINALNSGASAFMADLEDSTSPTWENVIAGQKNLFDAVRGTISFDDPTTKKSYRLAEKTATLLVRPRGLHLPERHVVVEGKIAPASLVDFGLYFFHNARTLLAKGSGAYFYLPKLESHLEARLWNDVFELAERELDVGRGSVRATVLIETLPAAFEMDEILYELRDRSAGLNCGRWDYIFSFIKAFRARPEMALPDRSLVTMEQPMMRAYTQLVVKTCHRRGVHAIGGMAAQIPIKGDEAKNRAALDKVRADKLREVRDGHDGTWVAHPALVSIAREVFDEGMPHANQIDKQRDDFTTTAAELVRCPEGARTEEGLRHNVRVGVQYLAAWLSGSGCVPLYDLMEDAATAEISRSQAWQWLHHGALVGGEKLTLARYRDIVAEELIAVAEAVGSERFARGRYGEARALFDRLATADTLTDFLTTEAYDLV